MKIKSKINEKGKRVPDIPKNMEQGVDYEGYTYRHETDDYIVTFTPEQEAKLYITAAQCQVQLDEMGLLDTVQDYMDNQATNKERIFWNVGKNYYRYSPTIQKLAEMLQIDLDDFWEAARKIVI